MEVLKKKSVEVEGREETPAMNGSMESSDSSVSLLFGSMEIPDGVMELGV